MKNILISSALLTVAGVSHGAPIVYFDEASYLADLARLGYTTIHESFEDNTAWTDSRNTITTPVSVTSQGIVWTSNYTANKIATGTVGGSAPDGAYAVYSRPHGMTTDSGSYCDAAQDPNIPIECFQNDGLKVASATGDTLYAFGGRFDSNTGTPKITFLLDGVDINATAPDNIENWQREGDVAGNWSFVGVIDEAGFLSAEVRELTGKDFQQVFLFSDDFTAGVASLRCDLNNNGEVDAGDLSQVLRMVVGNIADDLDCDIDNGGFGDGIISIPDYVILTRIALGIIPPL